MKASARIFISLVALAALGVRCVCKNPVSVKELCIFLWDEECAFIAAIFYVVMQVHWVRKSCPREGGVSKLGVRNFDFDT